MNNSSRKMASIFSKPSRSPAQIQTAEFCHTVVSAILDGSLGINEFVDSLPFKDAVKREAIRQLVIAALVQKEASDD